MAFPQQVSALTKEHFIPILQNNIFNSNPLTLKLLKNAQLVDGGVKINQPVEIAENGNSGWLAPGGLGTTAQANTEIADKAVYDWCVAYNSIIIDSTEKFVNQGPNAILSLLSAKMKNAELTLKSLFGTSLYATTVTGNSINTLNGAGTYDGASNVAATILAHDNGNGLIHNMTGLTGTVTFLPEGAVAGSIVGYDRSLGGIDSGTPGTNDYWNANLGSFEWAAGTIGGLAGATALAMDGTNDTGAMNFAAFCSTTSGVARGVACMTQMYQACSIDSDQPDLIVTTPVIYSAYETALAANKRWEGNSEFGDAGFQSLAFKGASVVHDSNCPAGHMYFLNTSKVGFQVHSGRNFSFEDYRPMETADGEQARIFWMGQLCTSGPRYQGLLVGGPTGY